MTFILPAQARLDLHMHSNGSDGRYDPDEVLRRAAAGGLDLIALTDHDLPPQLPHGRVVVGGHPLHVLHGVEVSAHFEGVELHLLCYFPGQMPDSFRDFCRAQAQGRAERYTAARENLALDDLPAATEAAHRGDKALTRLHLAQSIVAAGHARDLRDAFDRFVGSQHGKVPPVKLGMEEALRTARAAGAVTSWAHPNLEQAQGWTGRLAKMGLMGLEGYRPGLGRNTRRKLGRLARKHDLLLTGGSDWHGWAPHRNLGDFALQAQQAERFLRALGQGAALRAA